MRYMKRFIGCPYCTGNRLSPERSVTALFPEVAKRWHPKKNKPHLPEDFTVQSNKYMWWLCENGHETLASIYSRTKGRKCGECSQTPLEMFDKAFYRDGIIPEITLEEVVDCELENLSAWCVKIGEFHAYNYFARSRNNNRGSQG